MASVIEKTPLEPIDLIPLRPASYASVRNSEDDETALICQYIFQTLSRNGILETPSCREKTPLYLISSVGAGAAFVSWYPIIIGIKKIGIESDFVNGALMGGSWISYGTLYSWAAINILQDLVKKRTVIEVCIIKRPNKPCLSTTYKVTIIVIGFCATLANASFAEDFEADTFWTLVNIAGSWGICAFPIHHMVIELENGIVKSGCFSRCFHRKRWLEVRETIIDELQNLNEMVSEMDQEALEKLFQDEAELQNASNEPAKKNVISRAKDYAKNVFMRLFKINQEQSDNAKKAKAILKSRAILYPVKFFSAVLPPANIYANAKATLNLVSRVTNSVAIKSTVTSIALLPSYLTYSLNRDCFLYVIRQTVNKLLRVKSRPVSGIHYPKLRLFVVLTVTVISLLSSGIDYETARHIYDEDTPLSWTAIIISMVNSVALTLLPMIDVGTILLDRLLSRFSKKQDIKMKVHLSLKLQNLIYCIERASQPELEKFVANLMENEHIAKELQSQFPWLKPQQANSEI